MLARALACKSPWARARTLLGGGLTAAPLMTLSARARTLRLGEPASRRARLSLTARAWACQARMLARLWQSSRLSLMARAWAYQARMSAQR